MNRLPVRVIGALLLTLSLTVGSCQAFVAAVTPAALPDGAATPLDQRDIQRDSARTP